MRNIVFLSLMLIGLLSHCAVVRQPEPNLPTEPIGPAPEATPSPVPSKEAPLSPEMQPQPFVHEVRWPGETLSHIALWYTGAVGNWERIASANPGLKPGRIEIGDKILIPVDLLKVRKPMPRDYVHSLTSSKRPPSTRSVQPSQVPRKEELFGPVELLSPPGASEKTELYGPIDLD